MPLLFIIRSKILAGIASVALVAADKFEAIVINEVGACGGEFAIATASQADVPAAGARLPAWRASDTFFLFSYCCVI